MYNSIKNNQARNDFITAGTPKGRTRWYYGVENWNWSEDDP